MMFSPFLFSLLFASFSLGEGFLLECGGPKSSQYSVMLDQARLEEDLDDHAHDLSRRKAIATCFVPLVVFPCSAFSTDFFSENLDCLVDLPPLQSGSVRLYLCRHGQTEYNRLRKVQGARVDPPLNYNGYVQAQNAGKAMNKANPSPQTFFCSDLQRAKMTAELASSEINPRIKPRQLDLLREVDFGPVAEGQPVVLAKAGMEATYAAWAIGNVDYRPNAGGESGREVLNRAAESLKVLANEAEASSNGCLGAVSHSTFIRILIGMVLDEPLAEAASRKIDNGSITIIDIPNDFKTRGIGSNPRLLGGALSQAPSDLEVEIPICKIVRINESRHLPEIPKGKVLPER